MYIAATKFPSNQAVGLDQDVRSRPGPPTVDVLTTAQKDLASQVMQSLQETGTSQFVVKFGCDAGVETERVAALTGKEKRGIHLKPTVEWCHPGKKS